MSNSDPNKPRPRPGPWPPAPAPATATATVTDTSAMPPSSWAKRTGFRPKFSGETNASDSGQISLPPRPRDAEPQPQAQAQAEAQPDLEAGRARPTPKMNGRAEGEKATPAPVAEKDKTPVTKRREGDGGVGKNSGNGGANGNGAAVASEPASQPRRAARSEEAIDILPQSGVDGGDDDGVMGRPSHMKYELRNTPGLVPIGLYGFQHYLSILGSLILVPLVIVPAMGGTPEDTGNVVSTVLFVSGVTTLLDTSFGSRLPLIQGPSFVFLAPALAIINSRISRTQWKWEFTCDIEPDGKVLIKGVTTTREQIMCKNSQIFQMLTRNLCHQGTFLSPSSFLV